MNHKRFLLTLRRLPLPHNDSDPLAPYRADLFVINRLNPLRSWFAQVPFVLVKNWRTYHYL
ncbi:hypothetical protein D777_00970 [Marinobacter nitratireducens]|uniref:Uncharacterized protein n=1 Tax=Marinobacter nitratireducens TaxID=1137280 RepID=A0A072N492_9GAMM|nr:hypothetical protein D777_00970 [Marinobacter nitratireducens]